MLFIPAAPHWCDRERPISEATQCCSIFEATQCDSICSYMSSINIPISMSSINIPINEHVSISTSTQILVIFDPEFYLIASFGCEIQAKCSLMEKYETMRCSGRKKAYHYGRCHQD